MIKSYLTDFFKLCSPKYVLLYRIEKDRATLIHPIRDKAQHSCAWIRLFFCRCSNGKHVLEFEIDFHDELNEIFSNLFHAFVFEFSNFGDIGLYRLLIMLNRKKKIF